MVSHETSLVLRQPRAASGSAAGLPPPLRWPAGELRSLLLRGCSCDAAGCCIHAHTQNIVLRVPERQHGRRGRGGLPRRAVQAGGRPAASASRCHRPPAGPRHPAGLGLSSLRLPSPMPGSSPQSAGKRALSSPGVACSLSPRAPPPGMPHTARLTLDDSVPPPTGTRWGVGGGGGWGEGRGLAAGGASRTLQESLLPWPRLLRGKEKMSSLVVPISGQKVTPTARTEAGVGQIFVTSAPLVEINRMGCGEPKSLHRGGNKGPAVSGDAPRRHYPSLSVSFHCFCLPTGEKPYGEGKEHGKRGTADTRSKSSRDSSELRPETAHSRAKAF